MLDKIRTKTEKDQVIARLLKQAVDGVTQKFGVEEGVLYAKGKRPYVPLTRGLRKELLRINTILLRLVIQDKCKCQHYCQEVFTDHAWKMTWTGISKLLLFVNKTIQKGKRRQGCWSPCPSLKDHG